MRGVLALVAVVGLAAGGLWISTDLTALQLWLFGAGLVGLLGLITESFVGDPADRYQVFLLWIAPGLLVAAGLGLMQITPGDSQMPAVAAVAGLAGVLLVALRAGFDPASRFYKPGRLVANLIVYLAAFLLFALIYHTKERSLVTATSTGLVAFLAGLEVLRSGQGERASGWPLAALAALIVAETTWAVNYWPTSGLVGGALLLLTFYVFSGLLLVTREGGIDRRLVLEYGAVGIAGLLAVAWAGV